MADFFISYNKEDRRWAEWIASTLEAANFTVAIQAWDFTGNWVLQMNRVMAETKRTIAVLSPHYLAAQFTQAEWAEAFRRDPTGQQDLLIPVRVAPVELTGVFAQLVYVDLVDSDEATAAERLLERVRGERRKPAEHPAFPQTRKVAYPGYDEDRQRLLRARDLLAAWRNDYKAREPALRAAGKQAREWSREPPPAFNDEVAEVFRVAAGVAGDLRERPLYQLESAAGYGLMVHHTVFTGQALDDVLTTFSRYGPGRSAALVALDEERERAGLPVEKVPDNYAFEMAARVLEAACALASFSLDKLPRGFVDATGPAGDLRGHGTLFLAQIDDDPALHLMTIDAAPRRLGSFAARTLPLHARCARRNGEGTIDVVATDFEHTFRWSRSSAHPSMQYPESVAAAAFVSSALDAPVIATQADGTIALLDAGGNVDVIRDALRPRPQQTAVWLDPLTPEQWYVLTLTGRYDLTSQSRDGSVTHRSATSLWPDLRAENGIIWNSPADLLPTVLDGFPCVIARRQTTAGDGVLFLDPISLSSLRPPLFIDGFVGSMTVAAGRWLVVLFLQRGRSTLPRVGLWDLTSHSTKAIGFWLERKGDAYEPFVAAQDRHGFEVLFVLHRFDGHERWLCRFRWPSGTVEELEKYSDLRILPVTS